MLLPPDLAALRDRIEQLAALGLLVEPTEVDIRLPLFVSTPEPLLAQADAYRGVYATCLAVPACTGVTTWGIDDADTWLDAFSLTEPDAPNRPLLFDEALAPKAAYEEVVAVVEAPAPSRALLLAICGGAILARAGARQGRRSPS